MKYRVFIPPAKEKRMSARCVVQIIIGGGFDGEMHKKEHPIPSSSCWFEFEVPDDVSYLYQMSKRDGDWFEVLVHYTNEAGTLKQTTMLVPEKCSA